MEAMCVETHISIDFEEEELPEDLTSDSQHLSSVPVEVTREDIEAAYDCREL